ncbi:mitochondrial carrier, partial [Westerdykella ornata]
AGAIAAFTIDLLVYPLDTLKTRIQSPDYARLYLVGETGRWNRALFRGLYQGVGSVVLATLPSSGAFFTTYEHAKALLSTTATTRNAPFLPAPVVHAAASSLAELVSCAILTPAEVIKQNAQMVDTSSPSSSSSSSSSSSKPSTTTPSNPSGNNRPSANATLVTLSKFRHQPLALWRGYTALAGRNLPFTALQFPMFERLREAMHAYRERKGIRTGSLTERSVVTALSAGAAGSVAAVATTPVDVVKTRVMLGAGEEGGGGGHRYSGSGDRRKGAWAIGKEILRDKGVVGLWRGGALRAVWTFVGSGLYLGTYDAGRIYLARRRGQEVGEKDLV